MGHAIVVFDTITVGDLGSLVYSAASGIDGGTMFQLRNLVNRRNVKKDPSDDVNASEDFLRAVVHGHIIAAAMEVFQMDSLDGVPCADLFPQDPSKLDTE